MSHPLRVCVIGAGPSGLATLKSLKHGRIGAVCYEMGTKVGGLWAIDNATGRGGVYRSLRLNTSRKMSEFSDFKMSPDDGDFPGHEAMAKYLHDYAHHFGLIEDIRFRKEVLSCTPSARGYQVVVRDRESLTSEAQDFDAVVVANGHHWCPSFPPEEIWNGFSGEVLHATNYVDSVTPHDFTGDRVLVVGMGNSAMDIACELARRQVSRGVSVSARRGAWVLPRYILGRPIDDARVIPRWISGRLRRRLLTRAFQFLVGRMNDFGLPEPDHLIGEAHPTISSEFPSLVKAGDITMRAGIKRCRGRLVEFVDETSAEFDSIVFCTGYHVRFPFFDEGHISAPDNRLPLYQRVFHLDHRRVFFVGLAQTVGAAIPVLETQAEIVAAHLKGDYNLPDATSMLTAVERHDTSMAARFLISPRHTMQVVPEDYQPLVSKDRVEGRKRAQLGLGIPFGGHAVTLDSNH